ncbi:uncharacterized protein LOC127353763 isoform X3 [Dicentrarchus labrax]|uniref:uncharacterized protein LOC127353763 isoform X3 n=1 Tax=Dicentrarchus labrax TaxID=13489 RepID=UPI0021F51799|nr:uncharacterized protein LOC127353763 isoform X3 [Dicentrarchus labrax]
MLSSKEALVAHRRTCGVPDDNPYFFARAEAKSHLRGSDAIRQMAKECGAKHPETLSSTKLRKQVSTLSKVLNLKDNEMDTLANFLGHDIRVHRQYYRLPEGTLELAKVSKVLIALEQGRLSDYKGMSLDQIQIDPSEQVLEAVDSDLSETEMGGDSSFCSSASSSSKKRRQPVDADSDDPQTDGFHSDNEGVLTGSSRHKRKQKPGETDGDDGDSKRETSKKRSWSVGEVRAVEKTLKDFIESGKVPGKSDCNACIKASAEALKNRSWTAVKFYVKNRVTAIQRESAKIIY